MARVWLTSTLTALLIGTAFSAGIVRAQTIAATTTAQQDEAREPSNDTAVAQAAKGRKGAGDAQKRLDAAAKSLESGKAEQAVQQINAVLAGSKLDSGLMARALYLRGAAWRKQGKPAQAIADLTSALWLKGGLSEADRAAATAMRTEAYREAGLADQPQPTAKSAGRQVAAATPAASGWETDTNQSSTKSASGSGGNAKQAPSGAAGSGSAKSGPSGFFSNLFSGNVPAATPPSSSDTATARPREQETRQASIGESWSNTTDVKPASGGAAGRTEPTTQPAVKTTPAKSAPEARGGYRLQVAAVRSRAEAQTLAGKLKKEHATELASRQLDIDETVIGNMGTFYRVRIGPYADASEPRALCAKLRGSGLDCLIIGD